MERGSPRAQIDFPRGGSLSLNLWPLVRYSRVRALVADGERETVLEKTTNVRVSRQRALEQYASIY
jgi:hypothetical protein